MKWVFKTEYQPPPARPAKAVSLKKIYCFFCCPVPLPTRYGRSFFLSAKDTFQRPPATRWTGIFQNFFRFRPFRPVQIVVVSEGETFLPRRLAFLIFVRSKKQRENKPFRLANFKARWCREWKEKFSAPLVAKILLPGLQKRKKFWKIPVQRVAGGLWNVSLAERKKDRP